MWEIEEPSSLTVLNEQHSLFVYENMGSFLAESMRVPHLPFPCGLDNKFGR